MEEPTYKGGRADIEDSVTIGNIGELWLLKNSTRNRPKWPKTAKKSGFRDTFDLPRYLCQQLPDIFNGKYFWLGQNLSVQLQSLSNGQFQI